METQGEAPHDASSGQKESQIPADGAPDPVGDDLDDLDGMHDTSQGYGP